MMSSAKLDGSGVDGCGVLTKLMPSILSMFTIGDRKLDESSTPMTPGRLNVRFASGLNSAPHAWGPGPGKHPATSVPVAVAGIVSVNLSKGTIGLGPSGVTLPKPSVRTTAYSTPFSVMNPFCAGMFPGPNPSAASMGNPTSASQGAGQTFPEKPDTLKFAPAALKLFRQPPPLRFTFSDEAVRVGKVSAVMS
jgi:hypothetical protein